MLMQPAMPYVQARLQARHGLRLTERQWQQLEAQQALTSFLHLAAQSGIAQWVAGMHADDPIHVLENRVLQHFCDYVEQLSSWLPSQWRKATMWIAVLPDLALLEHIRNSHQVPQWVAHHQRLHCLIGMTGERLLQRLAQTSYAPFVIAWQTKTTLFDCWLSDWRTYSPEMSAAALTGVDKVADLLMRHYQAGTETDSAASLMQKQTMQRQQLAQQLGLYFRRYSQQPAAVFAHLALVALELERLRGNISTRRLMLDSGSLQQ